MSRCTIVPMPRTEIHSRARLVIAALNDGQPDLLEGDLMLDRALIVRRDPEWQALAGLNSLLKWARTRHAIILTVAEKNDLDRILVAHVQQDAEAFAAEGKP